MKQNSFIKKQGFYWLLLLAAIAIGACKQKSSESSTTTTTTTETMTDTSNPVRHMLLPEASPLSIVTQIVGITELSVRYHRPALYNDSDALSNRIPFNEIWSPGSRHISKFSTSDTILVKDKVLPPGSYSLLMIPGDTAWVMVFNTDTFYDLKQYDEKADVQRVSISTQKAPFAKDLTFSFTDIQPKSAMLALNWGTVSVKVPIYINNDKKIIETFDSAFAKADKNDWHIYLHAANYCLESCTILDKGLEWIDKSIAIKDNHANEWEKAELYAQKGDYKNAVIYGEKANELAKEHPDAARQKHFDDDIALWKQKPNRKQAK